MKSAEARLQATGMFHTTAIRSRALTSGSWGMGCSGSQKKMRKSISPLAIMAPTCWSPPNGPLCNLCTGRPRALAACPVPLGTVPIYEAFVLAGGCVEHLTADLLLEVIRRQAVEGVDFMTLHAGLLRDHVPLAARRRLGIVSRGGAMLAEWMLRHGRENPVKHA